MMQLQGVKGNNLLCLFRRVIMIYKKEGSRIQGFQASSGCKLSANSLHSLINELVVSQNSDGKVKCSSSRRRESRVMRRTQKYAAITTGMKRNEEIGLFMKPSKEAS